ncbi:TPA: hypothetical protein DCW32_02820 [Candidatus Woesebacteria bacterium]|nr:hypothetical protein [Candidatus Woesebacteria bacterium]HCC08425.1 hypothetical protein [Candidatus Woesebacteria bacterium]
MKEIVQQLDSGFGAEYVLGKVEEEHKILKNSNAKGVQPENYLYKAMTLFEFDKGILLLNSVPDLHITFALEFFKNLQKEYDCKTVSEKSMAEIVALNFVRILGIQRKINSYLDKGSVTDTGVGYLNVMSKELDRAERHYQTSLQMLRMLKTPPISVNIKTQTAIVGQNQVVQSNNQNDKPL